MKNVFRSAAAVLLPAAILAGCRLADQPDLPEGETVLFDSSFAVPEELTRSSIDGNLAVRWERSDEIAVIGASTVAKGTVSSLTADGRGAIFRVSGVKDRELFAVHPYAAAPSLEGSRLLLPVPGRQDGTFGSAHLCAARSAGTSFAFRNVTPLVHFRIGDRLLASSASRAELSAVAGECVAGTLALDDGLRCRWPVPASTGITIPLEGRPEGSDIWASILPGEYTKGLQIRLRNAYGAVLKDYYCQVPMKLEPGVVAELGDVGGMTVPSAGFMETFGGCRTAGAPARSADSDRLCDNSGWAFHNAVQDAWGLKLNSQESGSAWAMTPPLGIEGCATVHLTGRRSRESICGLNLEVCGQGQATGYMELTVSSGMTMEGSASLCGLSRDSRLKILTTGPNSTPFTEVRIVPGGEPFPYMAFSADKIIVPPCAGNYYLPVEIFGYDGSVTCATGVFRRPENNTIIYENGKSSYPTCLFYSGDSVLHIMMPENKTGIRRYAGSTLYGTGVRCSVTIIQEAYEN